MENLKEYAVSTYIDKGLKVVGISKDGHIMYGPLNVDNTLYTACELDACNGIYFGNYYAYISTLFHPYYMGCFGPSNIVEY